MEKKYDHQFQELRLKKMWHDTGVYRLNQLDVDERPLFTIDTPPPTVSGALHIGHIFSYTHTDLIARYQRMSGAAVFYPFGFDGNGLPTERFVEKKKSVTALSLGRSAFINLCLHETIEVEKKFQDLFQTMALSIDWRHVYSTIDPQTRKLSQQSFLDLFRKKFVYRKEEPALYCTTCYTSVSQAELEDVEQETLMSTLLFTYQDGTSLSIATTRPEFLASCVALLYHKDDQRYAHLSGGFARVPLYNHQVPLIPDTSVKMDKGTGLVMCCAFGDTSDIEWIKKHRLTFVQILQKNGRFAPDIAYIGDLKVKPAREKILTELAHNDLIIDQKKIAHAVNIHERCKNSIEFLSLPQWFIDIKSYKDIFMTKGAEISWYPGYMKSRYDNWVEHINWDWCISRQRFFGIPFPCWHCSHCGEILLAQASQLPIDPQETPYGKPCPSCGNDTVVADMDVMDTWNTSSLTPMICQQIFNQKYTTDKIFLPMSMRPQAHDIIRTWAFDTIVKSWMHNKQIPWQDIVISGHVLSTEKQKISKSQGNSPLEPENLLKSYPADVIRYWAAGAQLGADTPFSENQLKIGMRLIVKLWNAYLFVAEHAIKPEHGAKFSHKPVDPRDKLNQWIMHQALQTFKHYKKSFELYNFHKALEHIERFFWNDWCDNYLELIKDQFFNPDNYTVEQKDETRAILYQVGFELLQWYAPFLPYITDAIYQELYKGDHGKDSLHQTTYSSFVHGDDSRAEGFPQAAATVQTLLMVVQHLRKLKTDKALSLKTELHTLTISCSESIQKELVTVEKIIKGVARTQTIIYAHEPMESKLVDNHTLYEATICIEP